MYKNLAAVIAAACFLFPVSNSAAEPSKSAPSSGLTGPVKAAFVYVTPVFDAGWTHQHDQARKAVEKSLGAGVKTTIVENVAEGADSERVVRDLAQQGHNIIFTTSFGYMGRFLAGVAAGRMTKSNVAGYVAGFPIPEVLQGLNAFTLGMRSVNPQAQVKVVWLNSWFDPAKERDAAFALFNQAVDVISFHTASNAVMVAAQERGKLAIAYHSDMRKVAPDAQLMAVTHEWGRYYAQRVTDVQKGQWQTGQVWGGLKEGMVRVGDFGPKLPAKVRDEVVQIQKDIVSGKRHPFQGPFSDQDGKVLVAAGQKLSDAEILNMNYGVAGLVGKIAP